MWREEFAGLILKFLCIGLSKKRKRENRGLEIGLKLFKKLLIVMNGGMLQV